MTLVKISGLHNLKSKQIQIKLEDFLYKDIGSLRNKDHCVFIYYETEKSL